MASWRGPARPRNISPDFYVALSFGGMVGGLFAGLIAPFTFSWVAEYPILMALAALCRPTANERLAGSVNGTGWSLLRLVGGAAIAPSCTHAAKIFDLARGPPQSTGRRRRRRAR